MRRGPAAKFAFDPTVVAGYIDHSARYVIEGTPPRRRKTINTLTIHPHDARIIRRWREGKIEGATQRSVLSLFHHYGLTLDGLNQWAYLRDYQPVLRGQLNLDLTVTKESHA